jgi:hypothetical protein
MNACYSEAQATAIAKRTPYVIGMKFARDGEYTGERNYDL